MGNILKNEIDCTCEDFLATVYGKRTKRRTEAMKTLLTSVLTGQSTLVKDISSDLRNDYSPGESKRVQEMVSRWLAHCDFDVGLNDYLLSSAQASVSDRTTFAIDFSDISKEFGGSGMEGMERGWDGSRHCTAMGHDFVSVSIVGSDCPEAIPVYVKLGRGRHAKDELLGDAVDAAMEMSGGRGWCVVDRGMDDAHFIWRMKSHSCKTVIRIKEMGRDVFGNGKSVGATLADIPFRKAHLSTYRGVRRAEVRCAVGHVQYCPDSKTKNALTHDAKVLVAESRFDDKSIYLYLVCPDAMLEDPETVWKCAVRAAQVYCDRWQIETSFMTVKQEFALEKARVRTFRRLTNIFALCILAYVFMARHLHASHRFRKIVKTLNDNMATLALKMHSLLAAIRELYRERKVRFITGRPRKRQMPNAAQMLLFAEC